MRVPLGLALGCCAATAAALSLTACRGRTEGGDEPIGQVHGTIEMVGGPSGAAGQGAAGTVLVSRGGRRVTKQEVAAGKEFLFTLPVGAYELAVDGVGGACLPADVTVHESDSLTVTLQCQRK